ncbi:MAG TPA: hypothetical protein VH183_07470 [Burkholderiaceae bacterium]|nr:hypothetical protein [Burkholderiaceae bacterium]
MITRLQALLASALASLALPGWPQQPVAVQLHHRSAESLVTVLRPLIGRATLAGAGAEVLVRASPSDLPQVVRLIEQSDRPLRPLVVALREDPPPTGQAQPPGRAGSVTLSTGRPMPADPHGNGQVLSTQSGARPAEIVEGDPLPISMPATQSLWFGARGTASGAGGGTSRGPAVGGVAHFDAMSDFTARIWVAGETVAIDLSPRAGGRIDAGPDAGSEPLTVYGRLGQWIALADAGADASARAGLWIRVEAVPRPAGTE